MEILRKEMHIPFGIPSPKYLLEFASIFLRTETELLLQSRNVYPQRLRDLGFEFKFGTIQEAVKDLYRN